MAQTDRAAFDSGGARLRQHRGRRSLVLGVSLIEALVAMAVMAFGMLGVVGMQSTLRFNADVSRQRAEAVRIAQQQMETLRAYDGFAAVSGDGILQFEEIVSEGPTTLDDLADEDGVNTTFSLLTEVAASPAGSAPRQDVIVTVSWEDRRGVNQAVRLSSQISYYPPELTAMPVKRGDRGPLAQPGGRNPAIPREAVAHEAGTSAFAPPSAPTGTLWIFSNTTGLIVQTCVPLGTCTDVDSILLSGNVAFALPAERSPPEIRFPLPEDAAEPIDPIPAAFAGVGIEARRFLTATTSASVGTCFIAPSLTLPTSRLAYYCAVPRASGLFRGYLAFTGVTQLTNDPRPTIATPDPVLTDATSTKYRMCRYTAIQRNARVIPTGEDAQVFNAQHPWQYINATRSYTDRNFLVIQAGNDTTPYPCPDDDVLTPIQSRTYHHPTPP
jgi:Tfp pilus assembly protein PilV